MDKTKLALDQLLLFIKPYMILVLYKEILSLILTHSTAFNESQTCHLNSVLQTHKLRPTRYLAGIFSVCF